MMLAKPALISRPQVRPAASRPRAVVVRSTGQPANLEAKVQEALKEAEDACAKGTTADCAVAWDTVEELSAAQSHKKAAEAADVTLTDPLEAYCKDAPDADECRVYED